METTSNTLLALFVLLAGTFSAAPQSAGPLNMTWSTADGGGGQARGGGFTLNGTIGQPDAGAASGGAFTLNGGFWPGVETTPSGPASSLTIRLGTSSGGFNTVILTWPHPSTGWVLQQTANMSAPGGGWVDVTQPPVVNGAFKEVTLPATGRFCLFRLRSL